MSVLPLVIWGIAVASECITVRNSEVLARDLASRFPELTPVAPSKAVMLTPAIGVTRWISLQEGQRIWQKLGLPGGPSSSFCITRKSVLLSRPQLLDALAKNFPRETVGIDVLEYSRFPVPEGYLEFPLTGLLATARTSPGEAVLWRGKAIGEDGASAPTWVRVRMTVTRKLVVAKRDLQAGQRLEKEDTQVITAELFPLDQVPNDEVTFIGQVAKQKVRSGQRLLPSLFEDPYDVVTGQIVNVDVVHRRVHLRFSAAAEGKGRVGDWVWLALENGKRFRGRVSGPANTILEVGQSESGVVRPRHFRVNRDVQ